MRRRVLERVFPKIADNSYQGRWTALWVFGFFTAKSLVAAGIHMLAADGGAQSIASVALDQFTTGGADSVVTMFGLWGLEQLVIGLLAVAILLRYRALIPLMSLAYVVEYALRTVSPLFAPGLQTAHTPPGATADTVLLPLSVVMLVLSVLTRRENRT